MTEPSTTPQTSPATAPLSKWRYIERLKVSLEILAILTAGLWAYTRFIHDEAPGLQLRPHINAKLGWEKVTDADCQAEYEIQFQNIGKLPISIAETRISVWYLSDGSSMGKTDSVQYIDPMYIRQMPHLYSELNSRLVGDYGPGIKDTEGFSFVVKNTKGKRILFEIDIWSKEDAAKNPRPKDPTWHDFHWDRVCGDQDQKAK